MSYFPCDIPCMSKEELEENGIRIPNDAINTNAGNDSEIPNSSDLISRQAAIEVIDAVFPVDPMKSEYVQGIACGAALAKTYVEQMPSAQPERYTEEELRVFAHGISLSLLSKRSAQHWRYDEDTATEIEFLERLYEKVSADMRGEPNG